MPGPLRWLAVLGVYAAATAVMAAPYVNYAALPTASYTGDARLIIWTLAWDNHAVLSGLPLFDSNVFYPAACSLRYNEHLFGLSLFFLPVYAFSGNPVLSHNLLWLVSFILNAVAMHILLRRHGGSHVGAIAGSLTYTFSFYKMLHAHGHLHLIWTWLLPCSLVLLERWHERPTPGRAAAWFTAAILQALTSWYLAVMTIVATAIVLLWRLATEVRSGWGRRAVHLGAGVVLSALILWPFAQPYRSLPPAPVSGLAAYSADVAAYLLPPENTWMGQWWIANGGRGPRWIWGEQTLYLGWTAIALGLAGLVALRDRRKLHAAGPFLLLLCLALMLSFGPSRGWSAFEWLARIPGVDAFRVPARFAWLVLLALAVFVALGVDLLMRRLGRGGTALAVALLPVMLSEWFVVKFPGGTPQPHEIPAIYRHPALADARGLVSLPDYRDRPDWYFGADYFYYSTAHWRPIVNGFGRSEPPDHQRVVSHMNAFPGPNNARTMRRLEIDFVVLHAARMAGDLDVEAVKTSPHYDLVAQIDSDYLFKVRPAAGPGDVSTLEWGRTEPCRFGLAAFAPR